VEIIGWLPNLALPQVLGRRVLRWMLDDPLVAIERKGLGLVPVLAQCLRVLEGPGGRERVEQAIQPVLVKWESIQHRPFHRLNRRGGSGSGSGSGRGGVSGSRGSRNDRDCFECALDVLEKYGITGSYCG